MQVCTYKLKTSGDGAGLIRTGAVSNARTHAREQPQPAITLSISLSSYSTLLRLGTQRGATVQQPLCREPGTLRQSSQPLETHYYITK